MNRLLCYQRIFKERVNRNAPQEAAMELVRIYSAVLWLGIALEEKESYRWIENLKQSNPLLAIARATSMIFFKLRRLKTVIFWSELR